MEEVGRSRVSKLCSSLGEEVSLLRGRDLSGRSWPYLWLDAKFIDARSMRDLAPAARGGEADEAELLRVVSVVEREFKRRLRAA